MTKYYTYLLINSLDNQPFYAGKGTSSRMYQHKRDALNPNYCYRSVHRKIQNILNGGGQVLYERNYHPSEELAFEIEIGLIKQHGRKDLGTGILCNLTDGGEGGSNQNPESVEKRAAKHRGMKRSKDSRERMSQAQLRSAEERRQKYKGKACSPETSNRMSKSRKGKEWSDAAKNVKRNYSTSKIVLAHNKDNGSFVGEYKSISACGRQLHCDITAVWYVCEGTPCKKGGKKGKLYPLRSCNGYTFKYKD